MSGLTDDLKNALIYWLGFALVGGGEWMLIENKKILQSLTGLQPISEGRRKTKEMGSLKRREAEPVAEVASAVSEIGLKMLSWETRRYGRI
jgi:hypothetical protein